MFAYEECYYIVWSGPHRGCWEVGFFSSLILYIDFLYFCDQKLNLIFSAKL